MVRKSVKNKPLSFRERGFKIAQLLFDNPVEFKSESKAKKCVVGYPCSSTCISTKKNCRNKLAVGGEPYNFAKWVTTHLSLGNKLSKEQMSKADSLYNQKLSGLKPIETPAAQPLTKPIETPAAQPSTKPIETKSVTPTEIPKPELQGSEKQITWGNDLRDKFAKRYFDEKFNDTPENKAMALEGMKLANSAKWWIDRNDYIFKDREPGEVARNLRNLAKKAGVQPPTPATTPTETKPTETKIEENPETKALQEKKNKAVYDARMERDALQARHDDLLDKVKKLEQELERSAPQSLPGQSVVYSPRYIKFSNEFKTVLQELGSLTKPGTVIHSLNLAENKLSALQQRPLEAFDENKKQLQSSIKLATYGEADLRKPLNDKEKQQLSDIINGKFTDARQYFALNNNYRQRVNNFVQGEANQKYGLSQEEAAAIHAYTANGYVGMSAATRMQFKDDSTEIAKASILISRAMNEGLSKLPSYKEHGQEYAITYRGTRLPKEMIASYGIPGETVVLRGFTSTTTSEKVINDYLASTKEQDISNYEKAALQNAGMSTKEKTKKGDFGRLAKEFQLKEGIESSTDVPIKFIIQSKTGKRAGSLSAKPTDTEVIFASNTKFEVLESKYNKEKEYHEVSLREV